jgi:hypothetical protein
MLSRLLEDNYQEKDAFEIVIVRVHFLMVQLCAFIISIIIYAFIFR